MLAGQAALLDRNGCFGDARGAAILIHTFDGSTATSFVILGVS